MNRFFNFASLSFPILICSRPLLRMYSLKSSISVNGNELVYEFVTVPGAISSVVPVSVILVPGLPCNVFDVW